MNGFGHPRLSEVNNTPTTTTFKRHANYNSSDVLTPILVFEHCTVQSNDKESTTISWICPIQREMPHRLRYRLHQSLARICGNQVLNGWSKCCTSTTKHLRKHLKQVDCLYSSKRMISIYLLLPLQNLMYLLEGIQVRLRCSCTNGCEERMKWQT